MTRLDHKEGTVVALCISKDKHVAKTSVTCAFFREGQGLDTDAHAGFGHRQVSMLARSAIDHMKRQGLSLSPGSFGENMVVDGLDLRLLTIGQKLQVGRQAVIEITQIGKHCHHPCAIAQQAGYCIMPQQGIFARVIQSGAVYIADPIRSVS